MLHLSENNDTYQFMSQTVYKEGQQETTLHSEGGNE